jgi:hypothetical protein
MKKLSSCFCFFVLAAGLSGCGTPGFPRQSYDEKKQIKQLENIFNRTNLILEYYATNATETVRRDVRDKLIDGRLALINLNYNQFIARFSVTRESLDFGTEVTQLGLSLATTAVGGAETKTILGAISAGVTGSKLAIDKNFFFEKTVPVLITSMNAQRKEALAPILTGMKKSTDDYPLAQALSDMDAYYFAGTFIGALQAMQADAGAKEKQAQAKINSIRFEEDDSAKQIRAWLWPDGPKNPPNTNNVAALKTWKKDHQLETIKVERFLEEGKYKDEREQAAHDLKMPPIKPEN